MESKSIIILAILMITSVSAYYPGETIIVPNEMQIENLVYTIIDNSTIISPLDISINKSNITIKIPQDMTPDSFAIVFLENQTKEVVKIIKSGGGNSRTKYVDKNVTVYVPEYINTTTEVEKIVEVPIDNIEIIQTDFETWHILFAMAVGGCFIWFIMRIRL